MLLSITKVDMMRSLRSPLIKSLSRAVSTQGPQATNNNNINKDPTDSQGDKRKMRGWQIHEYGDLDVLQCSHNIKVPTLKDPNEVLVQVHAASVNPIDVAMMSKCEFNLKGALNGHISRSIRYLVVLIQSY